MFSWGSPHMDGLSCPFVKTEAKQMRSVRVADGCFGVKLASKWGHQRKLTSPTDSRFLQPAEEREGSQAQNIPLKSPVLQCTQTRPDLPVVFTASPRFQMQSCSSMQFSDLHFSWSSLSPPALSIFPAQGPLTSLCRRARAGQDAARWDGACEAHAKKKQTAV